MSEATSGGIGGGVILLILLVLVALAVGIWFVLRRRGESPASAWVTGPQTPARPVVADVAPVGAAGSSDNVNRPSDQGQAPEGSEYAEGGLSSLSASETDEAGGPTHRGDAASAEHPEPGGDGDEDGQVSGTAPQTPTQAFGEAEGTSRPDTQDLHSLLFDGPDADADSTPLFRSVRERLRAAVGEPVDSTGSTDADVTDDVATAGDGGEKSEGSIGDSGEGEPLQKEPDQAGTGQEEPVQEEAGRDQGGVSEVVTGPDAQDEAAHDESPQDNVVSEDTTPEDTTREEATQDEATQDETTQDETHEEETVQDELTQDEAEQDASVALTGPDAEVVPDTDSEQDVDAATEAGGVSGTRVRRISELHEVVDGGFGIGSAAVIADGAQPLGHPIRAVLATKTYVDLHSPSYDEVEPDLWFLDAGFAERAGFRHAD